MKTKILALLIVGAIFTALSPVCAAQEQGYFTQMGRTFTRGIKNVVSFPYAIPAAIREHDGQNDGSPRAFRDTAGFFDGSFRALKRLGCGVWDMLWCVVPGDQEGLPLKPETFF